MFFGKMWINSVNTRLDKIAEQLEKKVATELCSERRDVLSQDIKDNCTKTNKSLKEAFDRIRAMEAER